MPKSFSAYKGARSARLGVLPSRDPFLSHIWIPIVNRQTEMPGSLKLRVISTLSGSMKSKIFASRSCFVKPDRSITAAVLSSKESSPRSSSSSNATLRRCSSSPGWTTFISNFKSSGTTMRPSRWYNKYSDGKLLGKCSLKITYHQPTYLKGKPDRECSMSGVNHKSVSYRTATEWGDERQVWG